VTATKGRRPGLRVALLAAVAGAVLAGLLPPTGTPASAAVTVPATFHLGGGGFGHGVGMSQYGAYGMAKEGAGVGTILTHYYTGIALPALPDAQELRVNLLHGATTATLGSTALAAGGGGVEVTVDRQPPVLGTAADTWTLSVSGSFVVVRKGSVVVGTGSIISIRWSGTRNPGTAGSAATLLLVDGSSYRYGTADARVVAGRLEVVNVVRLHEEYLRGVAEMPSSWPAAALQAQVVAARTYALNRYNGGLRSSCVCHVYDSVSDLVFAGWAKESGPFGAQWVAAVTATSRSATTGLVATYGGTPISAFFFSSSGGRTQNSEDVWSSALPYARSVDDHWSSDPAINPTYAAWERDVSQSAVAAAFGLPDVVRLDLSDRAVSGSVDTATAWSSASVSATLRGADLRSRLGLPSAYVRRPYARAYGADRYATAVAVGRVGSPSGTGVVVVSGDNAHLVDGMVAAPLARLKGAPILFGTRTGLPEATRAEVVRRGATTAWLVGGTGALGGAVESALRASGVSTVVRIAGADRYATAAAVAEAMALPAGRPAVVANGSSVADALAASGPAAYNGRPILLVGATTVPPATAQALADLAVPSVVVLGGPSVVSDGVLAALPAPLRVFGDDRYATSAAVAAYFSPAVPQSTVVIASGADPSLVDSLAAGALGDLMLLTPPTTLPAGHARWLQDRPGIGRLLVVGGTAVVASGVVTAARNA